LRGFFPRKNVTQACSCFHCGEENATAFFAWLWQEEQHPIFLGMLKKTGEII